MVGLTAMAVPEPPGFQVFVVAPPPVKVEVTPAQTVVGFATAVTVGLGFTTKEIVFELLHPSVDVPVTVYTEVVVGVTIITVVVAAVLHVYELAPLAVKLAELLGQTAIGFELIPMVGEGFTANVTVFTFEQPNDVPVTVYTIVDDGLTIILEVVAEVFHKYVLAPLAVMLEELPEQTSVGFALTETTTVFIFTVIEIVFVFVQPSDVPVTV